MKIWKFIRKEKHQVIEHTGIRIYFDKIEEDNQGYYLSFNGKLISVLLKGENTIRHNGINSVMDYPICDCDSCKGAIKEKGSV